MTSTEKNTPATAKTPPADLQALLGGDLPRRWWQRPVLWGGLAVAVLVAGGFWYWQAQQRTGAAPTYVTEEVRRGNLTLSVSANGTLQPTRSVNVGSELSGTVRSVLVDVNDRVKKGQVLVELDTAKLSSQVLRSRASLASAHARLAQAAATTKEVLASLARLEEVARLSGGKVPSATELDSARAGLERAVATQASARANLDSAKASLTTDETNLSKASIRSPIDGTVLSRSVDPGNAVAASLQAVTLFTIAEDLRSLLLKVNVDEADVGRVAVGQKVGFTVSAFASRRFPATITRVSYGSTITDNVVTYVTQMDVNNADLSLRPGMTATSTITAVERQNVLLVPNTALRFAPADAAAAEAAKGSSGGGIMSKMMPRMPRTGQKKAGSNGPAKQLWVLREGVPVAVSVKTGISDGRMTEILEGEVTEGMPVITEQRSAASAKKS